MSDAYWVTISGRDLDNAANHDPTDELIDALSGEPLEPDDEPIDWTVHRAELEQLMVRLPALEADLIELHHRGVRQADAAKLVGLSQAGVSYRLNRARERLIFMRTFPGRTEAECRRDLADVLTDNQLTALIRMRERTSQSHVARGLGWSQGRVRGLMLRAEQRLRLAVEERPELAPYWTMATMLNNKRWHNILLVQPGPGGYQGGAPVFCLPAVPPANDGALEGLDGVGVVDRSNGATPADVVALDVSPGIQGNDVEDEQAAPPSFVFEA